MDTSDTPDPDNQSSSRSSHRQRKRRWSKVLLWSLVGLAALLLLARVLAPVLIERQINHRLGQLDGYQGSIEGVDLSVWDCSLTVEGLRVDKVSDSPAEGEGPIEETVATVPSTRIDCRWGALLQGRLVGRVAIDEPDVLLVTEQTEGRQSARTEGGIDLVLTEAIPITLTDISVDQGRLRWRETESEPPIDLALEECQIDISGLTNRPDESTDLVDLPSELRIEAKAPGGGDLLIDGRFAITDGPLRLDADVSLSWMDLTAVNDVLEASAGIDAEAGEVDLSGEVTVEDERLDGYVKVLVRGLDVLAWGEEEGDDLGDKLWEAIVGGVAEVLENQGKDTQAAKVPLSGQLSGVDTDLSTVLVSVLRHAFIQALLPGVDDELRWVDVDTTVAQGSDENKGSGGG